MISNLVEAWDKTTDEDHEFGNRAYLTYHNAMRAFANHYGLGFVPVTEAFVALSPNNAYHQNLRSLASVCAAVARKQDSLPTLSTYKACGIRAMSYLRGEVSFLDTVRGPKIRAFRENILYPSTSQSVTIDGHMICLWTGRDLTMKEAAPLLRPSSYLRLQGAFQKLARRHRRLPHEVQAVLWHYRKRTRSILLSSQTELFSGLSRWEEIPDPINYPPYP